MQMHAKKGLQLAVLVVSELKYRDNPWYIKRLQKAGT